jgi:hypothetical protein
MMTLWSIFRSPLMMGGHLPENDDLTLAMLTNDEVLAVNQTSTNNRELLVDGDRVIWAADDAEGDATYVAFFNTADEEELEIGLKLTQLGLSGPVQARDLWKREDLGWVEEAIVLSVEPHGAALLKVWPAP